LAASGAWQLLTPDHHHHYHHHITQSSHSINAIGPAPLLTAITKLGFASGQQLLGLILLLL
jgi:hypothetical protein